MDNLKFILFYSLELLHVPEPRELALNVAVLESFKVCNCAGGGAARVRTERSYEYAKGENILYQVRNKCSVLKTM